MVGAAANLPHQIGRYEIVGHLATGGMAEVLLARLVGPSGFERPVVLKRILPHLARTKEFVDMFVDEARIVAGIRHPNVVAVHELGRDGGELFLVLEYLEGESASGLMRRLAARGETLDYRVAAHIIAEACAGLHAAHELVDADGLKQNLVHRDVTPQNLFITYDGAVKVLDFGIAKAADRMTHTEAGQVKGKFEYMSPEQCLGKPLDRRSDIFALGVVLYEITTGHRLFKRATQLVTMKAICDEAIRPPSSLRPGYPLDLEQVCTRALRRRPDERYQTAAEMRRALIGVMRALERNDSAMPEEAVGQLMRTCFADRIETKAELLRRVRAGSRVAELPAAETDGSIEIPVAIDDAPVTEVEASAIAPIRRQRARWPLGLAGLGLAAGLGYLAVRYAPSRVASSMQPQPPLSTTVSANADATHSAAATTPSAATVASVSVRVESVPAATVVVGGQPAGLTPYTLTLARSDKPVDIEVRKEGFVTQRESIVPDAEQRIRITLPPAPRTVVPASRPTATATASAAHSAGTGGFHRFD